jgi:hypothetical protein
MAAETDSDSMAPKWQWRPAAKFDIGSVARFCDVRSPHEDWWYGILVEVEKDKFDGDIVWAYHCQHGGDMDDTIEQFNICEIQYDANREP